MVEGARSVESIPKTSTIVPRDMQKKYTVVPSISSESGKWMTLEARRPCVLYE